MATKKELQAQAEVLGVDFNKSDTKAVLEEKIAAASEPDAPAAAPDHPGPNERFEPGLCPVCGIEADHIHAKGV